MTETPKHAHHPTICFIGAGNMAGALIGGLISAGHPAAMIRIASPGAGRREALGARYGVATGADNCRMAAGAEVLVLAVKPQTVATVCGELGELVRRTTPLVVSVAAGIRIGDMQRWLQCPAAVVRAMPNTPSLIGAGASAVHAAQQVSPSQREVATQLLQAVGMVTWLPDEALIDVATATSGSGPAYFFLLMEALTAAAQRHGLSAAHARELVTATALGAARMAASSQASAGELRAAVTSPGGTTEQAMRVLQAAGFHELFEEALRAAAERARELGDRYGEH
jgi:pyrroline-5-carboxylate reductase